MEVQGPLMEEKEPSLTKAISASPKEQMASPKTTHPHRQVSAAY